MESTDGAAGLAAPPPLGGRSLWSQFQAHQQQQQQQQAAVEEQLAMEGEYSLNYNTYRYIGKGAFGFVRLAQKVDSDSMVMEEIMVGK